MAGERSFFQHHHALNTGPDQHRLCGGGGCQRMALHQRQAEHRYDTVLYPVSAPVLPAHQPSPEFSVAPGEASVHLNLVQSMFCGLSRVLNGVETCDVSGVNNAATEHNIKWIQHLNHRPETGTLDQESWNTLSRLYTMFVTSAQSPWTTRPELFMP